MGVISCKTDRVKEVVKAKVVNQVKYSMWIVCTCMVVGLQKKKKKKKTPPLKILKKKKKKKFKGYKNFFKNL